MKIKIKMTLILVILCVLLVSSAAVLAGDPGAEPVKPETPIIVTTCGQSPGALMIRLLSTRIKLECEQNDLLTAKDLHEKEYNTLIITMGTSVKGMGAAGTDIDAEVKRINEIVEEARKQGMVIVGAHIEGMARRVDRYDELSIETVTPISDILIVKSEVDFDQYFTNIANEKGLPIYYVEETLEVEGVLKEIFKVE